MEQLTVGYKAGVIVIEDDLLQNISALCNIAHVVYNWKIVFWLFQRISEKRKMDVYEKLEKRRLALSELPPYGGI